VSTPTPLPDGTERRLFLVTGVAFGDDLAHAQASLAQFNTCPVLDRAVFVKDAAESDLAEHREQQYKQNPEHWQYICDNAWIEAEPTAQGIASIIDGLRPLFTTNPTERGFAIWMSNMPKRALPDMAFSLHGDAYVAAYTVYENPADEQRNRDWVNAVFAAAQPVTIGQYLGDSDFTNRQVKFMADAAWQRLQHIFAERDPQGRFFRYLCQDPATLNQNHWQLADASHAPQRGDRQCPQPVAEGEGSLTRVEHSTGPEPVPGGVAKVRQPGEVGATDGRGRLDFDPGDLALRVLQNNVDLPPGRVPEVVEPVVDG
jgi:hypothetical protein